MIQERTADPLLSANITFDKYHMTGGPSRDLSTRHVMAPSNDVCTRYIAIPTDDNVHPRYVAMSSSDTTTSTDCVAQPSQHQFSTIGEGLSFTSPAPEVTSYCFDSGYNEIHSQGSLPEGYILLLTDDPSDTGGGGVVSDTVGGACLFDGQLLATGVNRRMESGADEDILSSSLSTGGSKRQREEEDVSSGEVVDMTRSKIFITVIKEPQQVEDNEDDGLNDVDDWNPIDEQMERINRKMAILKKTKEIVDAHLAPILIVHGNPLYLVCLLALYHSLHSGNFT